MTLATEINNQEFLLKGLNYSNGIGVEYDLVEAHKWFNIAAMKGNEEAKILRKELAEIMTANQIAAAQKAARNWLYDKKTESVN